MMIKGSLLLSIPIGVFRGKVPFGPNFDGFFEDKEEFNINLSSVTRNWYIPA